MRGLVRLVQEVRAPPAACLRRCGPFGREDGGLRGGRGIAGPSELRPVLGAMGLCADGDGHLHAAFSAGFWGLGGSGAVRVGGVVQS
jgi:hypothetical protein